MRSESDELDPLSIRPLPPFFNFSSSPISHSLPTLQTAPLLLFPPSNLALCLPSKLFLLPLRILNRQPLASQSTGDAQSAPICYPVKVEPFSVCRPASPSFQKARRLDADKVANECHPNTPRQPKSKQKEKETKDAPKPAPEEAFSIRLRTQCQTRHECSMTVLQMIETMRISNLSHKHKVLFSRYTSHTSLYNCRCR